MKWKTDLTLSKMTKLSRLFWWYESVIFVLLFKIFFLKRVNSFSSFRLLLSFQASSNFSFRQKEALQLEPFVLENHLYKRQSPQLGDVRTLWHIIEIGSQQWVPKNLWVQGKQKENSRFTKCCRRQRAC